MELIVKTEGKRQVTDITARAEELLKPRTNGVAAFTVLHTTAALTTADLDPGTDLDFLDFLEAITPAVQWRHAHNPAHTPAHLLSSIIGPSVALPVRDGHLVLGTWQRLVLIELDGPRERHISFTFLGAL
jgi:secondary thiamine-phosphate synthase enzyme